MHPEFSTLVHVLQHRARQAPDALACVFVPDHGGSDETRYTYAELDRHARAVAVALMESGATGERVFLLYPPGPDYLVAFLGCLYAGVVAVPAYPPDLARLDRTLPRLQAILQSARPRLSLTTAAIRGLAAALFQSAPDLAKLQWIASDTLDVDAADRYQEPEWEPDQLAFLQYTSGSTGDPKGVMLSHANLLANLAMVQRNFRMRPDDVVVSWLPPYHDMGLIGTILQPLWLGATAVVMSPLSFMRRPRSWLEVITRHRGTVAGSPNFGLELCVRKVPPDQRDGLDLSSLEVMFIGAEPIRAATLAAFADAFAPCGFPTHAFLPCYGLAEATLLASGAAGDEHPLRGGGYRTLVVDRAAYEQGRVVVREPGGPDTVTLVGSGFVAPALDLRIVDPQTGRPCKDDEIGAIWMAGPSVASGYWEREDATLASFGHRLPAGEPIDPRAGGGYLRSGDLGFMHAGELHVCGRQDDLIIVRGRNLHPQDLEAAVEKAHPRLRPGCCAAFTVDGGDGPRLVVVIESASPTIDAAEDEAIERAVQEVVAGEHGLRVDELVLLPPGTIAKTSSGKIQRRATRAAYQSGGLPRRGA